MAKRKTRGRSKGREVGADSSMPGRERAYPLAFRLKVVEEALRAQVSLTQLSRVFGPSVTTIEHWLTLYENGGLDALVPTPPTPPTRERSYAQEVKRSACRFAPSRDRLIFKMMGPGSQSSRPA